ncbi:MAG: VOC family protein [Hyphomicrobium sp.]|nr:VOC family protein [Hyphomicrobium sp.]
MSATGLVPLIRYRDTGAAVDWLERAFGLEPVNIVREDNGTIAYAELSSGRGLVMVGPVGDSSLDALLRQPDEVGGLGTQACYVAVDDVAAHYARAVEAGAEIVLAFGDGDGDDRAYAARDPEGHIWSFGVYSPWRGQGAVNAANDNPSRDATARSVRPQRLQSVLAGLVALLAVMTSAGVFLMEPSQHPKAEARPHGATIPMTASPRIAPRPSGTADTATAVPRPVEDGALRDALERAQHARRELARDAAELRQDLDRERAAREAAESEIKVLKAKSPDRAARTGTNSGANAVNSAAGGQDTKAEALGNLARSPMREPPRETATITTEPSSGRSPAAAPPPEATTSAVSTPAVPTVATTPSPSDVSPVAANAPLDAAIEQPAPVAPVTGASAATSGNDTAATVAPAAAPESVEIPVKKPQKAQKAQRRTAASKKPKPSPKQKSQGGGDPLFMYDP